jgi:stage II sporulation protein E
MQVGALVKSWFVRPMSWLGWDQSRQKRWLHSMASMFHLPVLAMGFLLGRAMILDTISPFGIAYLVVVYHLARKQWPAVAIALIGGAATLDATLAGKVTAKLLFLMLLQKCWEWIGKGQINYAPFVVASGNIGALLAEFAVTGWNSFQGVMAVVDVLLSFILTFIFVHSLPIFTVKRRKAELRHEEIICLVILIGSVMTGTMGWAIGKISVVHILSRYAILALALAGGGMLGSSMGVVTGLILSLSDTAAWFEISLLSFAGLLAGLFKEGRRIGVAVGFLLGAAILTLYQGGSAAMWISLEESGLAILLFMLTPDKLFRAIARFVPGTAEQQTAHQEYIRRLRDVTAAKVEQFTKLFQELSHSFREDVTRLSKEDEEQLHGLVEDVIGKACLGCHRFQQCWEQQMVRTYQGMTDLMAMVESLGPATTVPVPQSWQQHCVRAEQVVSVISAQYASYEQNLFWREKMKESRRLVSEQLAGMAEVMSGLAREIRHETQMQAVQEEQIREALEELGLSIQRMDIVNLEEGKVEIEVVMPHLDGLEECRKLVTPLLTEILGEPIAVWRKVVSDRSAQAVITLGSARRFELKTGAATAAKGGGLVSGDSYCYMNLGTGKYAVALSDGMGNGERAQDESSAALKLLRRLLQAGMSEERAVDTVNSILSLRTTDEMFATVDLALVDLNTAQARFMKIGSTPSFIKRGKQVHVLSAANPPIGILKEIEVEPVEMELKPGDLVIMMTDGVYDAVNAANKDAWMMRLISEIDTKDPQHFADLLLEKTVRHREGRIHDDMTVVISRVEHHTPEWSTIRLQGLKRMERVHALSG